MSTRKLSTLTNRRSIIHNISGLVITRVGITTIKFSLFQVECVPTVTLHLSNAVTMPNIDDQFIPQQSRGLK